MSMPHMHYEEYLVFERLHERQRQMVQQHQIANQHKPFLNSIQCLIGSIGTFFVTLGSKTQQAKKLGEHVV